MALFDRALVLVRGGGDIASGAIYRLHRAGFPVVVTELEAPLLVRRAVCYGEAVYSETINIEGIMSRLAPDLAAVGADLAEGEIPVVVDPEGDAVRALHPLILVDGRMKKANTDTTLNHAALVVALGPGYMAGVDCHAVVETNRGHDLGRVIYSGCAEPDTGVPGDIHNQTHSRVLRAPAEGHVQPGAAIGDVIEVGQRIATVGGKPVTAPFRGVLRGLIHERVHAARGMKIGDLDPRARRENCFTISDKSLSVGGGVLEAVLAAPQVRPYLGRAGKA